MTFRHKAGFALLLFLMPLWLQASYLLKNDILKPDASAKITEIGEELRKKTDIHIYLIATKERFAEGFNLVAYSEQFSPQMQAPYVLFIFAPYATILESLDDRGRVGLIPSSDSVKSLYDDDAVRSASIGVVASKDKNTPESKHIVAILQGYSELADQIAASKGTQLTTSIPNETRYTVKILEYIVILGTILVLWIYFIRPLRNRIRDGKK
jgi:hypothetical protein